MSANIDAMRALIIDEIEGRMYGRITAAKPIYAEVGVYRAYERPDSREQHLETEETLRRMIEREPRRIIGGHLDGETTIRDRLPRYRPFDGADQTVMVPFDWAPGTELAEIAKLRILGAKR